MRGVASEVVLVDLDPALAEAHALDIAHAMPFASGTTVANGDYDSLRDAGVVIIAAGVAQRQGETRVDLLGRNAAVFREVIGEIMRVCPEAILLVASNPVDIMTQITTEISGLPAHRVIGSGTILDTARFRNLLGAHLGVSPRSIHAYVLGEHGDSQVLAWSCALAGATPIAAFAAQVGAPITEAVRVRIDDQTRNAAYKIVERQGLDLLRHRRGAGADRRRDPPGRTSGAVGFDGHSRRRGGARRRPVGPPRSGARRSYR